MQTEVESDGKAPTYFAPGERRPLEELKPLLKKVLEDPVVQAILKSIPGSVVIVNKERQILAANKEILEALNLTEADTLVGTRPGEAFGCIHSSEGPSGCGTSRHCRVCGAVIAMLAGLEKQEPFKGECTLSLMTGERLHCMNFSVYAVPLEIGGERCLELVFHDISDKKLREATDRIFLHDLRNAVTGLYGWSELMSLKGNGPDAMQLLKLSKNLAEMIEAQSSILHAESGDLSPRLADVAVEDVLDVLSSSMEGASFIKRGQLEVKKCLDCANETIYTDPVLLNRILINMVKNAFEAIESGQKVVVEYNGKGNCPTFSVTNPGLIPEDTQLQIFQRAFSTKDGIGRGFGTYGMKMLGQNVLKGEVGFTSTENEGTRFFIKLPKAPD